MIERYIGIFICFISLLGIDRAYASDGNPMRFLPEIQKFIDWDKENSFPKKAVLFVGSSSINYWDTTHYFPHQSVINRGFGGAQTADVLYFYPETVGKYNPATVVVYVGCNDIAAGVPTADVFTDLQKLFSRMRNDFPQSKLIYLSNNPSFLRWKLDDKMSAVNTRMKMLAEQDPMMTYIDTASHLLTKQGLPNKKYFRLDGLHLNQAGYEVLTGIVRPYLLAK